MPKFSFSKLVRDQVQARLIADHCPATCRQLSPRELRQALLAKLHEELTEVHETLDHHALPIEREETVAELADVLETFQALSKQLGITPHEIEEARQRKHTSHGGFEAGIYIETVDIAADHPQIDHYLNNPRYQKLD